MKKTIFLIVCIIFLAGCGNETTNSAISKTLKKIEETNSYKLTGILEITNNENTYTYDVDVAYLKENNFRVSLKNKTNNLIISQSNNNTIILTNLIL